MNKEKGLDERPKWQDANEGDLGHEQAVGTTGEVLLTESELGHSIKRNCFFAS